MKTQITNIGQDIAVLNYPGSYIHSGIGVLNGIRSQIGGNFPNSTLNDYLSIDGIGVVPFTVTTYWYWTNPSQYFPSYTVWDQSSHDSVTVGYLSGSTSPEKLIWFYKYDDTAPIEAHIDFTAAPSTLDIGDTLTYTFFINF